MFLEVSTQTKVDHFDFVEVVFTSPNLAEHFGMQLWLACTDRY